MKKHNNTFKRVAASAVSMLTVAGMMPANVGGFLTQSSSIVAYAADANQTITQKATFAGIKTLINSVKINDVTYNKNDILTATGDTLTGTAKKATGADAEDVIVVNSLLSLTAFYKVGTVSAEDYEYDEEGLWLDDDGDPVDIDEIIEATLGDDYDEALADKYVLNNDGTIVINVDNEAEDEGDCKDGFNFQFAPIKDATVEFVLEDDEYDIEGEYFVEMEKKYIVSMEVLGKDGQTDSLTNFGRNAVFSYEAQFGDVIQMKTKALIDIYCEDWDGAYNDNAYFLGKDDDGNYIYQFVVYGDTEIATATAAISFNAGEIEGIDYTIKDGAGKVVADPANAVAGLQYSVEAKHVPADKSLNNDCSDVNSSTLVKEKDNTGALTGKKTYTTVFTLGYNNVAFTIGDHAHQRKYTVDGTKIYVECIAPEDDLAKQLAAEVTVKYGRIEVVEGQEKFVSADFVYNHEKENRIFTDIDIKDLDPVLEDNVIEKYLAEPVVKYYKKNDAGAYIEFDGEGTPTETGSYKVVVTFTKTSKDGTLDEGDNGKISVEKTFDILPDSVNDSRVRFFVGGTEYAINPNTGTYQIYLADGVNPYVITPTIKVDNVEINNYDNEDSKYYATGTTSAKKPGVVNVINITSNDPNNVTGDDDLVVKWEIVQEPELWIGDIVTYYTGKEQDVIDAVKAGVNVDDNTEDEFYTNLTDDQYELRFIDLDVDTIRDAYEAALDNEDNEAIFELASTTPPTDALYDEDSVENLGYVDESLKEYPVIAKYTYNQQEVYESGWLTIKPMPIKLKAEGYKTELSFGEKQSVAEVTVVDINNKDITDKFDPDAEFDLYVEGELLDGKLLYNANTIYGVDKYRLSVEDVAADLTGNTNYCINSAWNGEVGEFTVTEAVVKADFTTVAVEGNGNGLYYRLTEQDVADAYNEQFGLIDRFGELLPGAMTEDDVQIVGGTVTGKDVANRVYKVDVEFTNNFKTEDGKDRELIWSLGVALPVSLDSFEAEYNEDHKACTVVAKTKFNADGNIAVKEWGLVYDNKGLLNDDNFVAKLKENFGDDDHKGYAYKFAKASAGNRDELDVIITNSFVNRRVYAMAYIIYENGKVEFDTANASSCNYFDLVFDGLKINQTASFTKDSKKYVKLEVERAEAKGYTIESFGYLYNNKGNLTDAAAAQRWVSFNSSDSNVKNFSDPDAAKDTKITANIANTKYASGVKVYAKAYVEVKDKNGNTKMFMTNIDNNNGVFQYVPADDPANQN